MPMKNLSTLCYIEKDEKYLMLHRTRKEKDINKDKWIGVGGHFEEGESPEECIRFFCVFLHRMPLSSP